VRNCPAVADYTAVANMKDFGSGFNTISRKEVVPFEGQIGKNSAG